MQHITTMKIFKTLVCIVLIVSIGITKGNEVEDDGEGGNNEGNSFYSIYMCTRSDYVNFDLCEQWL